MVGYFNKYLPFSFQASDHEIFQPIVNCEGSDLS